MKNQDQVRKEVEERLIEKAMKDRSFRERLLLNPREVVELETGSKLPKGINLQVVEEKPDEVFLVLPAIHSAQPGDEELTEAELSNVAGGIPPPIASEDWSCSCFC
jgi:hypothetical protein